MKYPFQINSDSLDTHYWDECCMLMPCPECEQAIEITDLNLHLIKDCQAKGNTLVNIPLFLF